MMWYVYLIKNLVNDKLYVGKGKKVQERWSAHKCIAKAGNFHSNYYYLHAAIEKYGAENFSITTLNSYEYEKAALVEEIRLIAQYKTDGYQLYNLTNGGEGVSYTRSEETKRKMSISQLGNTNAIGNTNRLGKHHSIITKQKISESLLGKPLSGETKQKISGEHHHNAKCTWDIVNQIRTLFSQGKSYKELSIQFNLNKEQIGKICRYVTWKQPQL